MQHMLLFLTREGSVTYLCSYLFVLPPHMAAIADNLGAGEHLERTRGPPASLLG